MKISFIVPVYNSEKYLSACLESILAQDINDIEVICIDDCSEDNSRKILEHYQKDRRIITTFLDKNHGAAYTRNLGIKQAHGDYVWFVDADDAVAVDAATTLYKMISADNLDLICFDADVIYEDKNISHHGGRQRRRNRYREILSGLDFFIQTINNDDYTCLIGCQFWRRKFLLEHALLFPVGVMHEDVLFSFQGFLESPRLRCLNQSFYVYRRHGGSTIAKGITSKRLQGIIACILRSLVYVNDHEGYFTEQSCQTALAKYFCSQRIDLQNSVQEFLASGNSMKDLFATAPANSCLTAVLYHHEYRYINPVFPANVTMRMQQKQVIVYGAGAVGCETMDLLDVMGFRGYFIAVTNVSETNIYKKMMVAAIDDYVLWKDRSVVLVAVTDLYKTEIINNLNRLGFNDYYAMV